MSKDKSRYANRIYTQWSADLSQVNRSKDFVRDNFDRLFSALVDNNVSFDIAEEILPKAAKRHYPNKQTAKSTWDRCKSWAKCSFDEWLENWQEDIKIKATASFYDFYPLPMVIKPKKRFGPFSPAEYAKQRAYADSFDTLPNKQELIADDDI